MGLPAEDRIREWEAMWVQTSKVKHTDKYKQETVTRGKVLKTWDI